MDIREFIKNDRFARLLGIELIEASEGRAKAKMEINENHLNSVNIAHGGAIFSLADLAFAAASNSHGNIAVAINAVIYYVKAAEKGVLYADAFEVSRNNKIATYNINITNSYNELIASFHGMVYRKKETLLRSTAE